MAKSSRMWSSLDRHDPMEKWHPQGDGAEAPEDIADRDALSCRTVNSAPEKPCACPEAMGLA